MDNPTPISEMKGQGRKKKTRVVKVLKRQPVIYSRRSASKGLVPNHRRKIKKGVLGG